MDDELRMLHQAMAMKERLRVLAELQATYRDELLGHGFEQSFAEQLLLDWSRNVYGMTVHDLPDPRLDQDLDALLGDGSATADGRASGDPTSVPPGEPWLQLVEDLEDDVFEPGDDAGDERDAA